MAAALAILLPIRHGMHDPALGEPVMLVPSCTGDRVLEGLVLCANPTSCRMLLVPRQNQDLSLHKKMPTMAYGHAGPAYHGATQP